MYLKKKTHRFICGRFLKKKKKKDHTDNYDVSYKVTNVTEYERVRPALQSTALRQTALGGQTRII